MCHLLYFFFCKQKTAYEMRISDWSSDVCSSDLSCPSSTSKNSSSPLDDCPVASRYDTPAWSAADSWVRLYFSRSAWAMAAPPPMIAPPASPWPATAAARPRTKAMLISVDALLSASCVRARRSDEPTSELQSLMSNPYD